MDAYTLIRFGTVLVLVAIALWALGVRAHITVKTGSEDDGLNDLTNLLDMHDRRVNKTDRRAKRRSPESNGRRKGDQ